MKKKRMEMIEAKVQRFEEVREKLVYLKEELKLLNKEQREIKQWLYQDRPKEYIEGVLEFLESNKGKYPGAIDLIGEIKSWLSNYEQFISTRIKEFSPVELFRFRLVDESIQSLSGEKLTMEKIFSFLERNRNASQEDIRRFLERESAPSNKTPIE